MARLRQGLKYKYARAKNKTVKYKAISSKYTYKKSTPQGTTKKYAYTKKITLANGKARYYYT